MRIEVEGMDLLMIELVAACRLLVFRQQTSSSSRKLMCGVSVLLRVADADSRLRPGNFLAWRRPTSERRIVSVGQFTAQQRRRTVNTVRSPPDTMLRHSVSFSNRSIVYKKKSFFRYYGTDICSSLHLLDT